MILFETTQTSKFLLQRNFGRPESGLLSAKAEVSA